MQQLEEFFTTDKLEEIESSIANAKTDRWGGYDFRPRQFKEVYDKREAIAKVATMIEELKGLAEKAEQIRHFCHESGIDSMVSFNTYWTDIDAMLQANPASDALAWAASNHNC